MLGLGFSTNRSSSSEGASIGGRTSFTGLLDESYGGSAAAAYSLRRLSNSYEGKAVQIRRASDNIEVDVGFDANNEISLDSPVYNVTEETTGSSPTPDFSRADNLGQFIGNASYENKDLLSSPDSALIQCWYDQSGNSKDAIQSTAGSQPQLVSSGAIVTENGKPTLSFDGSSHYFVLSIDSLNINNLSVHTVCSSDNLSGSRMQFTLGTDTGVRYWHYQVGGADRAYYGGTSPFIEYGSMDTDQHLYSFIAGSTSTVFRMFTDGTEAGSTVTLQSGTPSTSQQRIGAYHNNGLNWSGTIQEFVLYSADSTNNRTDIESNINTFYSIY